MPVQKARALRNSPPHAGAKGPCPAKLPCPAACRRKRPMPRGTPRRRMPAERHPAKRQTIPSLAQPSPDKNNDLSGQKGTAADFFHLAARNRGSAAPRSPVRRLAPEAHAEAPSESTHRNPIRRLAPGARAEVPAPVQNPPASPPAQPPRKSCQKRAIQPTDAIGKKRRGFHR